MTTKGLQDKNNNFDERTVENKGKLILSELTSMFVCVKYLMERR